MQVISVMAGCNNLVTEGISGRLQEKRMLLVFTIGCRTSVSTDSAVGYIFEACTIGLIVKVSSFWLVYGWTIYIYNNILKKNKKDKGIHDDECLLIKARVFTCFRNVFHDEWVNNVKLGWLPLKKQRSQVITDQSSFFF